MDSLSSLPCASSSIGSANQLLAVLFQSLFVSQCSIVSSPNWPIDYGPAAFKSDRLEFDFIVVGAGSAGSVVASRLSENKNHTVLLLEAGPNPPIESEIPELSDSLLGSTYDWQLYAEPSKLSSLNMANGTFWPRGKMIGGCGSHNAMLYVRGNDRDYNGWAELGNPTWDFNNVLEHFKKSEDNGNPIIAANRHYHGVGGPLKINNYNYSDPTKYQIRDMFAEIGVPFVPDINSNMHLGTTFFQGTIFEGTRFSAAKAFLQLTNGRDNFRMIKNAHVTLVKFNANKVVTGVNFLLNGQTVEAFAKKEVILSAGTIGTPHLLLNSGIGPKEHLKAMNIEIIHDLQVGLNLQDHVAMPLILSVHKSTAQNPNSVVTAQNYYEYLTTKTGSFSNVVMSELNAFISTIGDPIYPNVQVDCVYITKNTPDIESTFRVFGYSEEVVQIVLKTNTLADILIFLPMLLHPKSRESVSLISNNPLDKPKIISGYLTEREDVDTIIAGIHVVQKLFKTVEFRKMEGEFVELNLPACKKYVKDSDDYWECYIRQLSKTSYHPVGTSKMGPASDKNSVVDPTLKVRGVHGLRVIDASIMPVVVSGNINAPTIMIGEKGSDFIKQDYK